MIRTVRQIPEAAILAIGMFFVVQHSIQNVEVQGHSMEPTLDNGERLVVNRLEYLRVDMERLARLVPFWTVEEDDERYLPFTHPPRRGDVIVFHHPENPSQELVKRVIGLPNERVEIRAGVVYVDGVELHEPYLTQVGAAAHMDCIPNSVSCVLQGDQYFVMGDNRSRSGDSRDWGPVDLGSIVGKVWFDY